MQLRLHKEDIILVKHRSFLITKICNIWKNSNTCKPIPQSEFWIPQKLSTPPNDIYIFQWRYCWEKAEAWFDKDQSCWFIRDPINNQEYPFPDRLFLGLRWIPSTEDNLPDNLRTEQTPKATEQRLGTYWNPNQSESESDSEQESKDQLKYKESSDLLALATTSNAGVPLDLKTKEPDPIEVDPFEPSTSTAIIIKLPTPPPHRDPTPPPPSPPMATTTTDSSDSKGAKFDLKKFTGKKEEAEEFMTNLDLYFRINPFCFTENSTRIAFALGNIICGAQQWKINKVQDLGDTSKLTISWDDYAAFKTSFLKNWSEVNTSGTAMNSIFTLMEKAKKIKISMEDYIGRFKEYVQKAGIVTDEAQPNNTAVSLFCQGLPYKVLDKVINQNPQNLTGDVTASALVREMVI